MTPTCVFCTQEIAPDEEVAGRGAAIAHARCADAALADDAHWDAIAAASHAERDESREAREARRGGCLTVVVVVLGSIGVLTALRRPRRR